MNLDDIKSPLPPRRTNNLVSSPVKTEEPLHINQPSTEKITQNDETKVKELLAQPSPTKKLPSFSVKPLIIVGIVLLLLVGGGLVIKGLLGKGKGTRQVTVNYWGIWEESAVLQGIIADFETKNPGIKVNYIKNQKDNYRTRLSSRLAGAVTSETPDIFRIHEDWMPMFNGQLASVPSNVATSLQLGSDYYKTFQDSLKQGGSYKAIPLMYDGLSLFYNKDLIDAAGVSLPRTWWGLENTATKLTVKDSLGNIKVAGVAMGLTENVDHWSDIVGLMLKQNGVEVLQPDEINTKKLQDVLTYYTLFKTKDQVWSENLPKSTELFANGKLAFYFGPSWRVFNLDDMNPGLKYEITTVPQLPTLADVPLDKVENGEMTGNLTNIHWGSYWVEGVNKNSSKQAEAWKFLEFISSKESLQKMYQAASQIRSFGEIYPRKSMAESITTNAKVRPFLSSADNATSWYLASRTFDDGLNDQMIKYFGDAINKMVTTNVSAKEVTTDLRNGINQLVQKYKISD